MIPGYGQNVYSVRSGCEPVPKRGGGGKKKKKRKRNHKTHCYVTNGEEPRKAPMAIGNTGYLSKFLDRTKKKNIKTLRKKKDQGKKNPSPVEKLVSLVKILLR